MLPLLALAALLWAGHAVVYALYPAPFAAQVASAARANATPPLLLLALMRTESRFRPEAVSAKGAVGLLQLTPATGAWVAAQRGLPAPFRPLQLRDPAYNIDSGAWYLAYLRRRFGGRLAPALAAYNAGPTPVAAWLAGGTWDGSQARASAIPYPETRLFVQRVLTSYAVYRVLYRRWPGA